MCAGSVTLMTRHLLVTNDVITEAYFPYNASYINLEVALIIRAYRNLKSLRLFDLPNYCLDIST